MSDRVQRIAEVLAEHAYAPRKDAAGCSCGWREVSIRPRSQWGAHVAAEIDKALPRYEQVGAFDDRGLLHRECRETDAHRKCVPVYREVQP